MIIIKMLILFQANYLSYELGINFRNIVFTKNISARLMYVV